MKVDGERKVVDPKNYELDTDELKKTMVA
jgi:hypothetical protein